MKTLFAAAERVSDEQLLEAVELTSHNPVINGLMKSISGLVAVLNGSRQILSVNDAALSELGIRDLDSVLGLRPGELIHCIHAGDEPAGCGTTSWCSSCGAAIAIVSSIEHDRPEERICAATIEVSGKQEDCCFRVQAIPIHFNEERFILLFMQDITQRQSREELDSAFYHDLNSTLTWLICVSDLISEEHG